MSKRILVKPGQIRLYRDGLYVVLETNIFDDMKYPTAEVVFLSSDDLLLNVPLERERWAHQAIEEDELIIDVEA